MASPDESGSRSLALTTLTALGVVYGDIGTSPLYSGFPRGHASPPRRLAASV